MSAAGMRVILVEDEPSALRYLRSTIELRCEGCEVVGTAENGSDGLEQVRRLRPDLVITDIRMAGMDGIQLAERVRREFPEVYSVIVSGYQDFAYARRALHSGVVDYLLKPVRAAELKAVIGKVGEQVRRDTWERRAAILRGITAGLPAEEREVQRHLPFKALRAAVMRFGGLPSRFGAAGSEAPVPGECAELAQADVWAVPGRDARELVFFCAEGLTTPAAFIRAVSAVRERGSGFSTLALAPGSSAREECAALVSALRHALDGAIVPGLTQTIHLDPAVPARRAAAPAVLDPSRESRIDFLLSHASSWSQLEPELRSLASEWDRDRRPLVVVEPALRQILARVLKASGNPREMLPEDIEYALDGLLARASSWEELSAGAWDLARRVLGVGSAEASESGAPALHEALLRFVDQNCAQPLTLQSVCDRFRVSQTYVSRLFRRFEGASFVEYLTRRRVDLAKRLIGDHPGMPLKDVAAYAGYHDPFYFSRVFKSLTGVPPSEWRPGAAHSGADSPKTP